MIGHEHWGKKAAFRDVQQHLKNLTNQCIAFFQGENRRKILSEQTRLLDLAFRNFVSRAMHYNSINDNFLLAFKAQQQCRQTMQFLNDLERLEKHGKHQQNHDERTIEFYTTTSSLRA